VQAIANMPYFASQIANYFIERGSRENVKVDPLKLQKLVYLAHGWHLLFENAPLIREQIEAWRYGPVVPYLYRLARRYGSLSIGSRLPEPQGGLPIDPRTERLLNEIWRVYGQKSGIELSMLTHEPGYAWDLTRRSNETPWNDAIIENSLIQDEFKGRQARG
jgi:uncharacterized phage-associated protein